MTTRVTSDNWTPEEIVETEAAEAAAAVAEDEGTSHVMDPVQEAWTEI